MAALESNKKLRLLLVPFFATSHIGPFTDFAVRLATANPDAVELTLAVTPANVHVVRSALGRYGAEAGGVVKIATYPFPRVDGLAPGVENLSAAGDDGWRIDAVAVDEASTRPAQEALIREQSPDAVITDVHFIWNNAVAGELGVPCVTFSVVGIFSTLVMYHLGRDVVIRDGQEVTVPGLPLAGAGDTDPRIRVAGVPETPAGARRGQAVPCGDGQVLRRHPQLVRGSGAAILRHVREQRIPEARLLRRAPLAAVTTGRSKHQRFAMPRVARHQAEVFSGVRMLRHLRCHLGGPAPGTGAWARSFKEAIPVGGEGGRMDAAGGVGGARRREGDASERVGAADGDTVPSSGWRVPDALRVELAAGGGGGRRADADVAAGVRPVHRGETGDGGPQDRGEGVERDTEHEIRGAKGRGMAAEVVARAVARFLEPGGTGEAARSKAGVLAAKARSAVAEGGSSFCDLRRLVNDLIEARTAAGTNA
ncbi:uncharacterized protein LOC100382397 [Zea mays]|uniref:Anthocyanidin 3-O-glucosyltransferase n=1 Tax=Zea mays TaxID=4577 RepID=C0P791_MAIZE|nr:uncharacterized protein LOC100382397 [Zea mays]ACN28857.1 unknown [Zea mays]AQK94607.1 Anthocyanidin 3-O-glucosyltransferase [Zea mays]|eukprot:NP_001168613.1 uncharacterized protein LOC100382397 [Zea mays]